MIKIINYNETEKIISLLNSRGCQIPSGISETVDEIIKNVREKGDKAVIDYTLKFDKTVPDNLYVTCGEIDEAFLKADKKLIEAIRLAYSNIRAFHEHQKQNSWITTGENGVLMGQRVLPLNRVGVYVPGGTAAYPSSVLMNVIPAKVAGVKEIIMATPPSKDGSINPNILAAAKVAGVDKILKVGGAQAIAAMAYGTEQIPRVDKITGPGNIFVAAAKRLLYGVVDIDMIAGPSEILIIADEGANPEFIAADMLSQAEHDMLASSILLCLSQEKAQSTAKALYKQMAQLNRSEIMQRSIEDYGSIIICPDVYKALELANKIAPEHLELMVRNPMELLGEVKNAGSVFLGDYCPEPLGDYLAGPNHVLPTSGTARFFSPLSVDSFIKKSSYIYYTETALKNVEKKVALFARSEGLSAHAASVEVRFKTNE